MDEKGVAGSLRIMSEENIEKLSTMFFGVSCAIFALRLVPEPEFCDEKWSEIRNGILQGSAHLLGFLVWRAQREEANNGKPEPHKLETALKEIQELKRIRREDAKANEKVVSIFAAREQSWLEERKGLRQQIGGLMNDMRVLEMNKEKSVSELSEKVKECESMLQSKDKVIEEGEKKRWEIEEKLRKAENLADELRGTLQREAQRHSVEISRYKTALIELVSNQRQLEAEMSRALRQVEAAKHEIDSVLEQKEETVLMAQRLSMELVQMQKDSEQKDQILSAMLRKSKLDTAEKQMLLKEVKSSKAKRKQAELEMERWKAVSESKHERHSLRNMFYKQVNGKSDALPGGKGLHSRSLNIRNLRSVKDDCHLKFEQSEVGERVGDYSMISDPNLADGKEEPDADVDKWVSSEAEKYKIAIDQRHNLETDAFAEQLRLKDEKLEAYRWRLLSMELESKRLQSHVEGLDHDIKQLRQENMKLENLLMDQEAELHSLRGQLVFQLNPLNLQKPNVNSSPHDTVLSHNTVWSKVKVIKRKPGQKRQEMKAIAEEIPETFENDKVDEIPEKEQLKDIVLTLQSPSNEIQQSNVSALVPDQSQSGTIRSEDVPNAETSTSVSHGLIDQSNSTWKMDIHALGVLYKIKRLKQQLLMLEKLTGKPENSENDGNNNGHFETKEFYALTSLLNKQVDRYQSLQGKTDDLCKRMHDDNLNLNRGVSAIARPEVETRRLEHFLEETFQLQRYIVATGQKLMEVQTKIASGFVGDAEEMEKPESFDIKRFAGSIRTLFREVQRGLEVRISRIIGDLEGTLACDGIIHLKR